MEGGTALEVIFRRWFVVRPAEALPVSDFYPSLPPDFIVAGWVKGNAHICFPPKISLCCTGGIPSFSSTRSFMRETWNFEEREDWLACVVGDTSAA